MKIDPHGWEKRRWTLDDDQRLRQLYQPHVDKGAIETLAVRLARTTAGIHQRAKELGLAAKVAPQQKIGTTASDAQIRTGRDFAAGWREIGGQRCYFRSKWEANYARFLQWMVDRKEILGWLHEPKTFWFDGIRRGVVSYKPDFKVIERNGSYGWHEVKGHMDHRSQMTLKRMAKFFPNEKLLVVDAKAYYAIANSVGRLIEGWE